MIGRKGETKVTTQREERHFFFFFIFITVAKINDKEMKTKDRKERSSLVFFN